MNSLLLLGLFGLLGIAFVIAASSVIIGVGWVGIKFISWLCRLNRCTNQWLTIQHFKRKGITDIHDDERIGVVNYLTNHGMDYADAVHCLDEIHDYLIQDRDDPWHREETS